MKNGEVIKAFKTYSTYFRNKFTYNTYTLGGVFKQHEVCKLRHELNNKGIICDTLEDCLRKKHRIDAAIGTIEGVSLEEYATEIRKNEKTYTYEELDKIIETTKRIREKENENVELRNTQKNFQSLIEYFDGLSQHNDGQTLPGKK